jgi:hypothetical protein
MHSGKLPMSPAHVCALAMHLGARVNVQPPDGRELVVQRLGRLLILKGSTY